MDSTMMTAAVLVGSLIAVGFFSYLFLMVCYPEWVGITGKVARKNLEQHEEGSRPEDIEFLS